MISILHISDFHYIPEKDADFRIISEKLSKDIEGKKIDLIVFSGDLVFQADSKENVAKAAEVLFDPLLKATGLTRKELIIAPGNHDMKRGAEKGIVKKAFDSATTNAEINELCQDSEQVEMSLENFKHFNDFIKDYYNGISEIELTPFYTINVVPINDIKIATVSINSAWRCTKSESDRGNLIFPSDVIDEIADKVKNIKADFALCTMHHNLSDFKDYVEEEIEDKIYESFNLLFTGHYHRSKITTVAASSIGLLHSVANAVYNRKDKLSKYGYTIIHVNELTYETTESLYRYVDNKYVETESYVTMIPMSKDKAEILDFHKDVRKLYNNAILNADNLFVSGRAARADGKWTFTDLFVEPVIKDKSAQEEISSKKPGNRVNVESILNSDKDILIFGQNKSGKTSLLWKVMLLIYKDYHVLRSLPFYISYKEIQNKGLDLVRRLASRFGKNQNDTVKLFSEGNYTLTLFIDDFDFTNEIALKEIKKELSSINNVRVILCSDETIASYYDSVKLTGRNIQKLYIHNITSKEVRQLTSKWPSIEQEKQTVAVEKIMSIFKQMHIPINYWTTSLFLWIFTKTDDQNFHNNFELVRLYIDELLNKNDIILHGALRVQYDDLLLYLAEFAEFVLRKPESGYTLTYKEWVDFTEEYIANHKKFTETTERTLSTLQQNGVILQYKDRFTFRLKGVFEFFLAYRMTARPELLKEVMGDSAEYLSFGNELELYAGFKRNDIDFVRSIFERTQSIMKPLLEKPDYQELDQRLIDTMTNVSETREVAAALTNKIGNMSSEEKSMAIEASLPTAPVDTTSVEVKTINKHVEATPQNVERALFILSRVYRNSLVCDDVVLGDEILDYILTGTCNLGFMYVEPELQEEPENEEEIKKLVKQLTRFVPLVVQTFFYDAASQKNLTRIFLDKLNNLCENPQGNQYKIFILLFTLLDLDIKDNVKLLPYIEKYLQKGALRFAAYTKLLLHIVKYPENKTTTPQLIEVATKLDKDFSNGNIPFNERLQKMIENKKRSEKK